MMMSDLAPKCHLFILWLLNFVSGSKLAAVTVEDSAMMTMITATIARVYGYNLRVKVTRRDDILAISINRFIKQLIRE